MEPGDLILPALSCHRLCLAATPAIPRLTALVMMVAQARNSQTASLAPTAPTAAPARGCARRRRLFVSTLASGQTLGRGLAMMEAQARLIQIAPSAPTAPTAAPAHRPLHCAAIPAITRLTAIATTVAPAQSFILATMAPTAVTVARAPGFQTKRTRVLWQPPRITWHFECLIFGSLRVPETFSVASRSFSSAFAPKATATAVRRLRSGFCRLAISLRNYFLLTSLPNASLGTQV
jgi:hypothetical protein